jgi:hypothetical protein
MKKLFPILIVALVTMLCIPQNAGAQLQANPDNYNFWYFNWLSSGRLIVKNTIDTLPNAAINLWHAASPQNSKVGGSSALSLQIIAADTFKADIYVDAIFSGGGGYRTILADSVVVIVPDTTEFAIRTVKTNLLETLDERCRVRVSVRNVTQGNNAADLYYIRWIWKP